MNWGASKGIDSFEDVCVVLNKTAQKLLENRKLIELNPKTKNKLAAKHKITYFILTPNK